MRKPTRKPPQPALVHAMGDSRDAIIQRLWDLVRYQRGPLFEAELITADEFSALVQDHPAVERLETYDNMREKIKRLERELEEKRR